MALPKIKLPPIQTKYKIIGLIGIGALFFSFYYDHLYKPHAKNLSALQADLKTLESTINIITTLEYPDLKSNRKILNSIRDKKELIIDKINKEETSLPLKANVSSMLEKIAHIADKCGVEIKSLEPKNFEKTAAYESMSLNLELNVQFLNLLTFLEKIRELPVYPSYIKVNVRERPLLVIQLNLMIFVK